MPAGGWEVRPFASPAARRPSLPGERAAVSGDPVAPAGSGAASARPRRRPRAPRLRREPQPGPPRRFIAPWPPRSGPGAL